MLTPEHFNQRGAGHLPGHPGDARDTVARD
jgi:hypothetical protein